MNTDQATTTLPAGAPLRLGRLFETDGPLPLVIEPAPGQDRGAAALAAWLREHPDWTRQALRDHGALLLRGFAASGPAGFEAVARAIDPELKNDYLGTSPRDAVTDYVFSASELPPFYPIPQHLEMSFLPEPPRRLFFYCEVAPGGIGGETPLCDFRRVLRDLDPAVRERFERLGVRNIRNYGGPPAQAGGRGRWDPWQLKRWDQMFRTEDRAAVEARCGALGLRCEWRRDGRLRLANEQPAVRLHPQTGEPVWFNHAQVFHLSAAPGEYQRIARRTGQARYALLRRTAAALVALRRRILPPEDQAMHCTYGDGSPIPDADMDRVRDAIWRNLVCYRWRTDDMVVIDNFAVSHGRMPYRGPRRVLVCWA